MQTKQLFIRISADELADLKEYAKGVELNHNTLGAFIIRGALRAFKEHDGPIRLPLFFELKKDTDARFNLNEPKPQKPTRK